MLFLTYLHELGVRIGNNRLQIANAIMWLCLLLYAIIHINEFIMVHRENEVFSCSLTINDN